MYYKYNHNNQLKYFPFFDENNVMEYLLYQILICMEIFYLLKF